MMKKQIIKLKKIIDQKRKKKKKEKREKKDENELIQKQCCDNSYRLLV